MSICEQTYAVMKSILLFRAGVAGTCTLAHDRGIMHLWDLTSCSEISLHIAK